MACYPKVDQPCPLSAEEIARIDGFCGHCAKTVVSLDGLSDEQRRQRLRDAEGPLCVSYRRPLARTLGAGLGAALALSVPALAIEVLPTEPALAPSAQSIQPRAALVPKPAAGPECDENGGREAEFLPLEFVSIIGGGVSDPANAEWIDDSDLPDLPMISAPAPER